MASISVLELWNGKTVIGYYNPGFLFEIWGKYIRIRKYPTFKEGYGGRRTTKYVLPYTYRYIKVDETDTIVRLCLDIRQIRGKRRKQLIKLLKTNNAWLDYDGNDS